MQMFLKTYQQQQLTGVWSLMGATAGQYAALYMVQGNLHYVCMAGYHPPWLAGVVDAGRLDAHAAGTLLDGALSGQRPLMDAVMDAGLGTAESVVRTFQAWLLRRVGSFLSWGQCQFEYRPEVRLPFSLPVVPIPLGSIIEMAEAVDAPIPE
jgi:hypothetical protein